MDIVILAAGYGTQLLGEYTEGNYIPKGLVEVAGKNCLDRTLGAFSEDFFNQVGRIILVSNREGLPYYQAWAENSKHSKLIEIVVDPFASPEKIRGVPGTTHYVFENCNLANQVLFLPTDNLVSEPLDDFWKSYEKGALNLVWEVSDFKEASRFGVVVTDEDNNVLECLEKPKKPRSKLVRTILEIWDQDVFEILDRVFKTREDGDKEFFDIKLPDRFRRELIADPKVDFRVFKLKGQWFDIGSGKDLQVASEFFGGSESGDVR